MRMHPPQQVAHFQKSISAPSLSFPFPFASPFAPAPSLPPLPPPLAVAGVAAGCGEKLAFHGAFTPGPYVSFCVPRCSTGGCCTRTVRAYTVP